MNRNLLPLVFSLCASVLASCIAQPPAFGEDLNSNGAPTSSYSGARASSPHSDDDSARDRSVDYSLRELTVPESDNRFDGFAFQVSKFVDTDFSKESFRDLFDSKYRDKDSVAPWRVRSDDRLNKRDLSDDIVPAERDDESWQAVLRPIADSYQDWVPDKPDPTDNGGFTTSPDNGAPVPYRLNGHPDLERARP